MKETATITLILIGLMALCAVWVQPINAEYQGDITINADGSISPSTSPMRQDGDRYVLTGDLIGSRIIVMRSNMTLDGGGHTIQGENTTGVITFPDNHTLPFPSSYGGIYLESVHNVTVKGFCLRSCLVGVSLNQSSHVTVSGNNITGTWGAYYFSSKLPAGIFLWESSNNTITGNHLAGNEFGVAFQEHSEHNIIDGNTILGSANKGVIITESSSNTFYHNNFFDNQLNVYDSGRGSKSHARSSNVWDNGNEGNYWSDHSGPDANGDGIGGTPYVIDSNNQDRHPLMQPWEPDFTPPHVSMSSPENKTYTSSNVTLTFSTSEPTSKISYSLDGQDNVTITGNTTLNEVPNGSHNLTLYATDESGNTGTSEIVYFRVEIPFPTTMVVAPIASVAVVGISLLVYFKKRKRSAGIKHE
jgi:parallel beta-helix repeat protein